MAAKEEYPFGTPQEQALMCENHNLMPIDVTCEDCEEFICSKCAKEDHKDHNWITISTAAVLKTRGLLKSLTKIEEEDIQQMNKEIEKASQQIEENKKRCKIEISRIQKHFDAIVEKLHKIKEKHEKTLTESLEYKNAEVSKVQSSLKKKKKCVMQHVKSMRENASTMTDIILIKAHRELTKALSTEVNAVQKYDFSLRHESVFINEKVLESMMGQTFDVEQITVTEITAFQCYDEPIYILKALNEDSCLLTNTEKSNVEQVNKNGEIEKQFNVDVGDMCVTDNKEVYVTDWENKSISCLSPSGSVSPVFSSNPLIPMGICQTMDGGLLITLADSKSGSYQPISYSRRLVRHMTLTGDVIREYEYKEDGQGRLFTLPRRVTQNGNSDICVINWTSKTIGELVILSFSGCLKFVYPEQNQRNNFSIWNLVCDAHCNIIVSEILNSSVQLLSAEGEFLRYLLTENQIYRPTSMSLCKSTLWVSDGHGCVKVFQYKS
ncbi:uncharacterized protein LOC144619210 [Crassostrea virginica]